jgi:hypothetical protein
MGKIVHGTLTPNTVYAFTLDAFCTQVTITNRSQTGEIYFRVDGSDPAVGGAESFVCLGTRAVVPPNYGLTNSVRLISTDALKYTIAGETQ